MSRPEDTLPPELHYSASTARSYTTSSRIQKIQADMTHRALELLDLREPSMVLDIGCGSGLSGEILSGSARASSGGVRGLGGQTAEEEEEEAAGEEEDDEDEDEDTDSAPSQSSAGPHTWIGLDISDSMLAIARFQRHVTGDLLLQDIGSGLPFRPSLFDAALSISCIQWLCTSPSSHPSDAPSLRLKRFFTTLYACMRRGARGVFQFYPRDGKEKALIAREAVSAGFRAGLLEDDEGSKNAKVYLVVQVGGGDVTGVVRGMEGVDVEDGRKGGAGGGGGGSDREGGGRKGAGGLRGDGKSREKKRREKENGRIKGSKEWILRKKDQAERKGKVVKASSKYTGRRRRMAF